MPGSVIVRTCFRGSSSTCWTSGQAGGPERLHLEVGAGSWGCFRRQSRVFTHPVEPDRRLFAIIGGSVVRTGNRTKFRAVVPGANHAALLFLAASAVGLRTLSAGSGERRFLGTSSLQGVERISGRAARIGRPSSNVAAKSSACIRRVRPTEEPYSSSEVTLSIFVPSNSPPSAGLLRSWRSRTADHGHPAGR